MKIPQSKSISPEDTLRYYHPCANCISEVEVINRPPVAVAQLYFIS